MKKAILLLFMFIFCGLSYGATLTPNNVPKVNTGGSTPKIEDSSIWAQGSNVGIGTTDPQYALDVSGEINASTDITVNGTSVCRSDATNCPSFLNGWTDGGANVILTTSSDNVGIGTINPAAKLHVKGGIIADGNFSGMLLGNNMKIDGDTTRKLCFSQTLGTNNEVVCIDLDTTANTMAFSTMTGVTDFDMTGFTVTADAFVGDGSGLTGLPAGGGWVDGGTNIYASPTTDNVAIGTTTPTQKLTVVGTVAATAFTGDGSALTGIAAGGWTDGGTNVYVSTTTDNVGIGTTTPTAALLVENAGTQASFRVNDSAVDTTPFLIDSSGNVGISTTTASDKFTVGTTGQFQITSAGLTSITSTTGSTDALNIAANSLTSANGLDVSSSSSSQTVALLNVTQSGNASGTTTVITNSGSSSSGGTLNVSQSGTSSTGRASTVSNLGLSDSFYVTDSSSDATPFLIASDGNVGIGTTTATSAKFSIWGTGTGATPTQTWKDSAGTQRMVAMDNGTFGIGTTAPGRSLDVVGTVKATAFEGDGSGLTGLSAGGWTDNGASVIPTTTSDQIAIGTTTPVAGAALTVLGPIAGGGSGPLSITNGNVGIGTFATPTVLLHVGNTAGTPTSVGANDVYIQNDLEVDGAIYGDGSNLTGIGGGAWVDGGTNVYVSPTTDNVGVGTTTPHGGIKLDVRGTQYVSGNIGIGTFAPVRPIEIKATSGSVYPSFGVGNNLGEDIRFLVNSGDDNPGASFGSADAIPIYFFTNDLDVSPNGPAITLDSTGENVGIGTLFPTTKFQVNSTIRSFPTDSPPTCNASLEGGLYYDNSLNEFCDCDGSSWAQVDGGGAC